VIPTGSMDTTLLPGDYVWVSKFSYGYSRHSFPFGAIPFEGRVWAGAPERGDVAVFMLPKEASTAYVKRVVGLPGETVRVRNGAVEIGGEKAVYDYLGTAQVEGRAMHRYRETLPGGRAHEVLFRNRLAGDGEWHAYVVPDGSFFMMGDNRDSSTDSRNLSAVGFVPDENLIGRADQIFFSVENARPAPGETAPFLGVRWDRLFRTVR
jgi:signal peptidase I